MPIAETMRHVVRSVRTLGRHPWHSLGVALLLALGLGPLLALSALADRMLLHPAPYPDADRVVMVHGRVPDSDRCQFNARSFQALQEGAGGFERLAAFAPQSLTLGRGADAFTLNAARVTSGFFGALKARPLAGRLDFTPEEDRWGGPAVVVLTERLWRQRFQGERALLGRSIVLDGRPHTVVGILPADLTPPSGRVGSAACFVPAAFTPEEQVENGNNWEVVGRISPGTGLAQVQASLDAFAAARVVPGRTGFRAAPIAGELAARWQRPLAIFGAATLLLLLLSGANAAHLILARLERRRGDMAVATALGAPASCLAGTFLMEGLALGMAGLGLGFLAALGVRHALVLHFGLTAVPPFRGVALAAGVLATFLLVLTASAAPAWLAARTSPMGVLKAEGRGVQGGGRRWVLGIELAMASVLLVGASLLLRTLLVLAQLPTGLREPEKVLTATILLPGGAYGTQEARLQVFRALERRLAVLPGVIHAGLAQTGPFFKPNGHGQVQMPDGRKVRVNWHWMAGDLPGALGLELREGRLPRLGERACLLSENLGRELWPSGNALGQVVDGVAVVGIVSAAVERDPRHGLGRQVWMPLQPEWSFADVLLRGEGKPGRLVAPLREAVREVGPELQILDVSPLSEALGRAHGEALKTARLLGGLALLSLVLSGAGIYGVASQLALQRRREFGVRLAFGATPGSLAVLVMRQGLRLVLLGLGAGLLLSGWTTLLLKGMLQGVGTLDPMSYLLGSLALVGAALLAMLVPALRAARVPPAEALRAE